LSEELINIDSINEEEKEIIVKKDKREGDFYTFKVRVKDNNDEPYLKKKIYDHKHVENMLIILTNDHPEDRYILLNYKVMRAVLYNNEGGQNSGKVKYISGKYGEDKLFLSLKETCKGLPSHNVAMTIKRLNGSYKSYETKQKNGDKKARKPKQKKLKKVNTCSLILDQGCFSLKKKDMIGISLGDGMRYVYIKHEPLLAIVKDFKNIQSIKLEFSNVFTYISFSYREKKSSSSVKGVKIPIEKKELKFSGLDLGSKNTASVFIDDLTSDSVIFDGELFIKYNSDFNKQLADLQSEIAFNAIEFKISKSGTKYATKYNERGNYLRNYVKFLYEKRNLFFESEIHKCSKRIVEYLILNGVTCLILSKNLGKLKNNGNCKMDKKAMQSFIQIPFMKLLSYIEYKCLNAGIFVDYIDEAYTSKTSCISDDVNNPLAKVPFGKRVKRGLLLDRKINKIFNCDINGAVNHIKKYTKKDFSWLQFNLKKLCNPVKIKCDYDFQEYLRNSGSGKKSIVITAVA
jgi:IS605 OrfB family transposase